MKKMIGMLTALMAALTMTACSSVPEITGTDYTVEAPVTYEVGFFKGKVEEDDFDDATVLYRWAPTKENIVKHADAMIEGTVISSVYTSLNDGSCPWTKLDVVVNESYDGDLCAGDAISIYYMGGYMPLKEHYELTYADGALPPELENAEGMYHFVKSFEEAPKPGSTFLFPLSEAENTPFPAGAYEICCTGKHEGFAKTGDGVYYCKSNEIEWTADELRTLIEERDAATLEAE